MQDDKFHKTHPGNPSENPMMDFETVWQEIKREYAGKPVQPHPSVSDTFSDLMQQIASITGDYSDVEPQPTHKQTDETLSPPAWVNMQSRSRSGSPVKPVRPAAPAKPAAPARPAGGARPAKPARPAQQNDSKDFIDWDAVWAREAAQGRFPRSARPAPPTGGQHITRPPLPRPAEPLGDTQRWNPQSLTAPVQPATAASKPAPSASAAPSAPKPASKPAPHSHQQTRQKSKKPFSKTARRLRNAGITAAILVAFYCIAVFSNIPFIAKWRTIYIETAMGTMTHQWLATAFIPQSVIDKVMNSRFDLENRQDDLSTGDWEINNGNGDQATSSWSELQAHFSTHYPEIDQDSLLQYVQAHEDEVFDTDGYLFIDKAGLEDGGTSIRTTHGDQVLALDTRNGIVIVKVTGEGYVGRMAIVKDPAQVSVGLAKGYGSVGAKIKDIVSHNDGILGINASGFYDPEGHGNGAAAYGLMISHGEKLSSTMGSNYKMIGFDNNDKLNIGKYKDTSFFRDAVEFKPILVLDGEKMVEGSAGWGIQPRSAIGQGANGQVFLLIIDGRAPGYSIGATMGDLADIMLRYGAVQASNLDGGSSSIMYYNGREISKPSAADKVYGRHLPNAFIVSKAK